MDLRYRYEIQTMMKDVRLTYEGIVPTKKEGLIGLGIVSPSKLARDPYIICTMLHEIDVLLESENGIQSRNPPKLSFFVRRSQISQIDKGEWMQATCQRAKGVKESRFQSNDGTNN